MFFFFLSRKYAFILGHNVFIYMNSFSTCKFITFSLLFFMRIAIKYIDTGTSYNQNKRL